jgi:serine/threonine-protein kinase
MQLNVDPGFDADLELAQRALGRGWVTREGIESAILAHERTPSSRMLDHLPLTPGQRIQLLSPEPAQAPPEIVQAMEDPGRRVDHYVLGDFLHSGGMGRVYKAWDLKLSRWIALKFLKAAGDERSEAYFEREARLAAGLSHPNIAAIYGSGHAAGESYIAMQYLPGETLEKGSGREGAELVRLIRDAARAVAHANARGVVHRDLKPSNLMVTPDGRIYVLDFGLARPVEAGGRHSATGKAMGTPAYMSPEQARGGSVDARTDVYGLGATLYECLARRAPFTGTTIYDVLRRVEESAPSRLRDLNPRVDRDLETIALKCLEKDPARRYATADELADDLDRYLGHDPIRARPAGIVYRARRRIAKRKAVVLAAAATTILAGVLGWWLFVGRVHSEHLRLRESAMKLWAEARGAAMAGVDREGILKRAKEARAAFDRALLAREEPQALVMRGRCLQLEARDEESIRSLERAQDLDPENAEARLELAKALLTKYQKSRGFPTDFTVIDEKSSDVTLGIKGLPAETPEQRRLRERGEKLLAAGGAEPSQAALLRGLLALGTGEHARAAESLSEYTRAEPWDAQALWLEGVCRYYARHFQKGIEALDRSIRGVPDATAFRWRGILKEAMGHYDEAIADFTKALEADPASVNALLSRGLAKTAQGKHEEAIADFTKAFELNPKASVAVNNRGNAKSFLGRFEEAIEDFTKAVGLEPAYAGAYNNRGNAKAFLGRVDDAIGDFEKALKLDPALAAAWYNLGRARSAKGSRDEAIAAYTKAIELEPDNAKAITNRGLVKSQKGLKDEAIADFMKALQIDPKLPEAWSNMAFAKLHKGLGDEAAADWKKALEVAPPGWPSRTEIQGRLANLEATRIVQGALKLHEEKRYSEAIAEFRKIVDNHPKSRAAMSCAYNIACGYAQLGEKERALEWLEKSVAMGWTDVAHLEKDPDLDPLRADERYRALLMKLKEH